MREKDDTTQLANEVFNVYECTLQNGIVFGPDYRNDNNAYAEDYDGTVGGNIVIPAAITLADGKTRMVTEVDVYSPNASSITIPASVTDIWQGVGMKYDENDNLVPVPGFTIFGTTGSAAQVHANKYGILFRDLAAEAEAARQGTPDGSLPKVKIAKPKAAKKAATVKWKKLNKKQLKKSKAQKIEIWVCPNGGFGPNDTIMKTAGKKKASLKVKGLKKGTYFVKVRAIKYVNGAKMVGPWSKVKKVKIKK